MVDSNGSINEQSIKETLLIKKGNVNRLGLT